MTLNLVAVIKALVIANLTVRMILVFVLMMVIMLLILVMMVVGVIRKVDANGEATIKGGKTKPK